MAGSLAMTAYAITLHVLSAIALAGVVSRLAHLHRSPCSSAVQWHGWVWANVMIGMGLLAQMFQMPKESAWLVTAGLALYFGVRWHRRSGDQ